MRVERAGALLASMYANNHRPKGTEAFKLFDFMPHQDEPAISLDEAMEKWV